MKGVGGRSGWVGAFAGTLAYVDYIIYIQHI
jgi:hypothetical protein